MIDYFARRHHFIDHLAPIWLASHPSERGTFYVSSQISDLDLVEYARSRYGILAQSVDPDEAPPGLLPILCASYDDLVQTTIDRSQRDLLLMEHGVGITFDTPGYAGGHGLRDQVNLFLSPNLATARKTKSSQPRSRQIVIGTPKLDPWFWEPRVTWDSLKSRPIIAVSFHWDGSATAPEAGNAFREFDSAVRDLARSSEFTLIGHSHPKIATVMKAYFEDIEIPYYDQFENVMRIADVYVNDASSTLYEFLVTDKPVVILNSSKFRRSFNSGVRFWDYTDVGIQVNPGDDLRDAIYQTCRDPHQHHSQRAQAVVDLYPFFGYSAGRASGILQAIYG